MEYSTEKNSCDWPFRKVVHTFRMLWEMRMQNWSCSRTMIIHVTMRSELTQNVGRMPNGV